MSRKILKACCFALALLWLAGQHCSASFVSAETLIYSDIEKEIETIAIEHGYDAERTLTELDRLADRISDGNAEDFAYFLAYRCYLQS